MATMGGLRLVFVAAIVGLGCGDDSGARSPEGSGGSGGSGSLTARISAHPDVAYLPTQLDGSGSSEARGRTLSYAWRFVRVPTGSGVVDAALVASGSRASFVSDRGGTYTVELTVRTPDG